MFLSPRFRLGTRIVAACAALALALPLLTPARLDAQIPVIRPDDAVNVSDPSEMFLKAFTATQQGEKLEADGNLKAARLKYRFGASLLDQLSQGNANWQPLIVRYRMRKTTESLRRLDDKMSVNPGGSASGGSTGSDMSSSGVASDDDPLPSTEEALTSGAGGNMPDQGAASAAARAQAESLDRAAVELRNKLGKAQKDLKTALDQLSAAQKDKQATLKDKGEIEYQLQSAKSESRLSQKRFERTKADRDDLQSQVDKAETQLKDAISKNPDNNASRRELRAQVGVLKDALAKAQASADAAAKNRDELTQKLAESNNRNTALTKERDDAVARSELTKDAAQKILALQSNNDALTQKLTTAEKNIADLTADSLKKKEELEGVRGQLSALKEQLTASRDQNDKSATAIADLRVKLDDKARQLDDMKAHGMTTDDVGKMSKENELLRGIVMRQLKDQARRVEAKQLLTDELARLEVKSDALTQAAEELGRSTLQLTDQERALFKDPQVAMEDVSDPSTTAISIAAVRTKTGAAAAIAARPGATPLPSGAPPAPKDGGAGASNPADGSGDAPQVETAFRPKVAEELVPMANEAKEDFDRGRYADAEAVYDKLLARDPKNTYLLANQGVVLFRQDKLKSAEVSLKKALAAAPKDPFSQSTLGIVYYRMHRYDDALNALTQAILLDPKNATAHNYLGITSSQKGWPEAAIEETTKAIQLNPNYADAHFNIAVIYATNQPPSKDRALEHYKRAISLGATPDRVLEKLLKD